MVGARLPNCQIKTPDPVERVEAVHRDSETSCARPAGDPLTVQELGRKCGAESTREVRAAFGPVRTRPSQRPPPRLHGRDVDAQVVEGAMTLRRQPQVRVEPAEPDARLEESDTESPGDVGAAARSAAVDAIIEHLTPDQQTTLAELADAMLRGGSRERRDADIACRWCDWSSCDPDCPVDASVTDDETVIDEPGRAGSPRARGSGR